MGEVVVRYVDMYRNIERRKRIQLADIQSVLSIVNYGSDNSSLVESMNLREHVKELLIFNGIYFRSDLRKILEKNPKRLLQISGIGPGSVQEIIESAP